MLYTICLLLLTSFLCCSTYAVSNIDSLIAKANIYYQRPLHYGEPRELLLSQIVAPDSLDDIKLIVHGFLGSRNHSSIKPLANAYLTKGTENVFLADWSDAATLAYHTSRFAVSKVSLRLAKRLEIYLKKHNISTSSVHVLGHSLGAHIAGGIGRYFNSKLERVTGLDPALPLFTARSKDGLYANAARFVDVVHTDFPIFGDLTPRGTVDFYPGFGHTPQHGCDDVDLLAASKLIFQAYSCSHNRAVLLYAESVVLPKQFPSLPCSFAGIEARRVGGCLQQMHKYGLNSTALATAIFEMDETKLVYMGEQVSVSAKGNFYLDTNGAPPFGMGVYTSF